MNYEAENKHLLLASRQNEALSMADRIVEFTYEHDTVKSDTVTAPQIKSHVWNQK